MIFPQQTDTDELFTGYESERLPSETDPFCNDTENSLYSESYSRILPAFFFRTAKCGKKPSRYEKKNLRYYYNTSGIILASKLFIEAASCAVFYIFMFLCSTAFTSSQSLYYSALSDETIKYSFRILAAIISTASVFFAGCRFSSLSPGSLMKKCDKIKTTDIVICFMTGLFISGLSNVIIFSEPHLTSEFGYSIINPGKDILQITAGALYTCIVVPVTEGLIFRGIALKNFSRASQRFGILTASFFCALSTCSFPSMIPSFLMSIVLCGLTVRYSSVIPSILLHIAVNFCGMTISVYNSLVWGNDITLIKTWTIITLAAGGIFVIISIIKLPLPSIKSEQRRRGIPLLISSPFAVLLIPLYICSALAEILYFMYR